MAEELTWGAGIEISGQLGSLLEQWRPVQDGQVAPILERGLISCCMGVQVLQGGV